MIKSLVKYSIDSIVSLIGLTNKGRDFIDYCTNTVISRIKTIEKDNQRYSFFVPNNLNYFRADTLFSKEPDTIEWINGFDDNSSLWDIGANIGLYSIYAAKKKNTAVYAFEPSFFNLELLAKNIHVNGLSEKIIVCPIPCNSRMAVSTMKFSQITWGGALSAFDHNYGYDGKELQNTFSYSMPGMTLDDFSLKLGLKPPNYLKIDVDGIEHEILRGAEQTLKSVSEILIEINTDFHQQTNEVHEILTKKGFQMISQAQSNLIIKNSDGFDGTFNQIWKK